MPDRYQVVRTFLTQTFPVKFDHVSAEFETLSEAETAYTHACVLESTWRVHLDRWYAGRWEAVATFAARKVVA